jgi:hypothetical protein
MLRAPLAARRPPVYHRRLDHWPLSQVRPTDRQGLTLSRRIQPVGPDDSGARGRHMHAIPPDKLCDGHVYAALGRAFIARALSIEPIAERHHPLLTRDQPPVGEGPTPEVAGQIGEHPGAMGIPLADGTCHF